MRLNEFGNRMAHIDLSAGSVEMRPAPEDWLRKYIGGRGLGVRYVLEKNLADIVAIGRGLITDPELVSKSLAGKPENVVECTDCQTCYEFFDPDCEVPGLACSANPSL